MSSIPRSFSPMRSLRLLALVAPALLLPAACEDPSGSSSGGAFNPEGGAGFEAGSPAEAGPAPDAGSDVVAPPIQGVTVTVLDRLAPKADARVITHDATGAVVADLKTDAAGKVVLAAAPGMVTVLTQFGIGSGRRLEALTYAGVSAGDNLVVDVTDPEQYVPTTAGSYAVSFGTPFAGASDYIVRVGRNCTNNTMTPAVPLLVAVSADCLGNQNAVLAVASAGLGDLAFGFVKNAAKPAAGGTVNVGPLAFTAKGTTTLKASNLAVGESGFAELVAIANGTSFFTTNSGGSIDGAGVDFATPTGFADAYQSSATGQLYDVNGTHGRVFVRRAATTAPASETLPVFDFATALPGITKATLTAATVSRPDVTLDVAAPMTAADGAVAFVGWSVIEGEDQFYRRWAFILPPATTAFKVPALPADVDAAAFVPQANATVNEVLFVEASQIPSFKELKSLPVAPGGLSLADASVPLPAAGTVRISRWTLGD